MGASSNRGLQSWKPLCLLKLNKNKAMVNTWTMLSGDSLRPCISEFKLLGMAVWGGKERRGRLEGTWGQW